MSKRDQKCGPTGIPRLDALRDARRDSRFKLYVGVKIHSPSLGSVSGKTLEISERGLSATLSVDLPVGEVVQLAPQFNIGPVNVPATVRNRNGFRYGFQFVEPNPAQHLIRENCCLLERIPNPSVKNRCRRSD
jgi:PilZ domain